MRVGKKLKCSGTCKGLALNRRRDTLLLTEGKELRLSVNIHRFVVEGRDRILRVHIQH